MSLLDYEALQRVRMCMGDLAHASLCTGGHAHALILVCLNVGFVAHATCGHMQLSMQGI